jgi:hypothetical protein
MRFLVKVNMPVEAGNRLAKAGKLGTTIQSILSDLKPEAASQVQPVDPVLKRPVAKQTRTPP